MDTNTAASNVIPFSFDAQEVRALLINGEPWFVASDICASLSVGNASLAVNGRADRQNDGLDEDEKGIATVNTPFGDQQMLVISESGLYSLIFKSRKKEAKRFQKWVTAEVLPAIRKHGQYVDGSGKMSMLVNDVIGVSGANLVGGVISQKVSVLPVGVQRQARHKLHAILHTRFNVPRTEMIPADKLDTACQYIGSYVLEGEWLEKSKGIDIEPGAFRRYLVSFNSNGEQQITPVPADACVMTHQQMIKAMLTPGDLPVSHDEMFEFAHAVLTNLQMRIDCQTHQLRASRAAA